MLKIESKWSINRFLLVEALKAPPLLMSIPVAPFGRVKQ